ncbi:hypothetical protein OSTOST_16115, partial [Ostertagia ostertagi]
ITDAAFSKQSSSLLKKTAISLDVVELTRECQLSSKCCRCVGLLFRGIFPPDMHAICAVYKYSLPRANLDVEVDMNEKRVKMSFVRELFEVSIEPVSSFSTNSISRNDLIELTIKGSGFLWHMIRFIVTVLHEIGLGNEQP